jgi:hypothetical protein
VLVLIVTTMTASAQGIPRAITTPDKVETSIGTLEFKGGAANWHVPALVEARSREAVRDRRLA